MTFADKLKYYRQAANLTQAELADKIGVSQKAVSSWETGRNDPNMGQVVNLCKILDCSMADLTNTRTQNIGEVSMEDVLVKIGMMEPDELEAVEHAVHARRRYAEKINEIKREKEALELKMAEMKKRLDELESMAPGNRTGKN